MNAFDIPLGSIQEKVGDTNTLRLYTGDQRYFYEVLNHNTEKVSVSEEIEIFGKCESIQSDL